jgi:hypothetical protein
MKGSHPAGLGGRSGLPGAGAAAGIGGSGLPCSHTWLACNPLSDYIPKTFRRLLAQSAGAVIEIAIETAGVIACAYRSTNPFTCNHALRLTPVSLERFPIAAGQESREPSKSGAADHLQPAPCRWNRYVNPKPGQFWRKAVGTRRKPTGDQRVPAPAQEVGRAIGHGGKWLVMGEIW